MQNEVSRRNSQQNTGHTTNHESDHERNGPHHRQFVTDTTTVHREQPVENLRAGRDRNNHRRDTEERVNTRARTHGEEVMQPYQIRQDGNHNGCIHHRCVTKQTLGTERRNHFREHTENRQNQNINFRVAPDPDQVHVHHGAAAQIIREEVGTEQTVNRQHCQYCCQNRECSNNQNVCAQCCPCENRHFHHVHARRTHLNDGDNQIHAG